MRRFHSSDDFHVGRNHGHDQPPDTGSHAAGNITYEIVAGQVTFDSTTKEYSVPVLVGKAVPLCRGALR
jgi:hypothetical protein